MSSLLAIDPGTAIVGWAYCEGRELKSCGVSKAPKEIKDVRQRAQYHRGQLQELGVFDSAERFCEIMWFRHSRGRGKKRVDPQDLIDVNLVAGVLGTEWAYASEWKGGIARDREQRQTWWALTPDERLAMPCTLDFVLEHPHTQWHNAFSAAGILMARLGRAFQQGWL